MDGEALQLLQEKPGEVKALMEGRILHEAGPYEEEMGRMPQASRTWTIMIIIRGDELSSACFRFQQAEKALKPLYSKGEEMVL